MFINMDLLSARKKPPKYTKFKETTDVYGRRKQEKEYDFYKCDYCNEPIRIISGVKHVEMTGGTHVFTPPLVKKSAELALCNKCLKPVLRMLEKEYDSRWT